MRTSVSVGYTLSTFSLPGPDHVRVSFPSPLRITGTPVPVSCSDVTFAHAAFPPYSFITFETTSSSDCADADAATRSAARIVSFRMCGLCHVELTRRTAMYTVARHDCRSPTEAARLHPRDRRGGPCRRQDRTRHHPLPARAEWTSP